MEEEEAGTPPRLKVVTAKLCNGKKKENSNEVSTFKKTLEKAKKGRMQRRWKEHGVSRSSNRKSQQFRLNSFFFRGGCWFGWTWLRISLGEEECLFFLGGDLGKANKESKSFFWGETKRGRVSRIFNSDLFPEHKTICIMYQNSMEIFSTAAYLACYIL